MTDFITPEFCELFRNTFPPKISFSEEELRRLLMNWKIFKEPQTQKPRPETR